MIIVVAIIVAIIVIIIITAIIVRIIILIVIAADGLAQILLAGEPVLEVPPRPRLGGLYIIYYKIRQY